MEELLELKSLLSKGKVPDTLVIESAIKKLPEVEVRELANWLQDYLDEMWDRQIEADLVSGRLDGIISQAEEDIAANRVRNANEVLCND